MRQAPESGAGVFFRSRVVRIFTWIGYCGFPNIR